MQVKKLTGRFRGILRFPRWLWGFPLPATSLHCPKSGGAHTGDLTPASTISCEFQLPFAQDVGQYVERESGAIVYLSEEERHTITTPLHALRRSSDETNRPDKLYKHVK